jgi:hypothetical protein
MGLNDMVEEAQQLVDEILTLVDDLPEQAEEFGDSVRDKAMDISEFIEDRNHVTSGQLQALRNMREGIARWLGE